jgi:osmotically inducible lipoprotein OsmB
MRKSLILFALLTAPLAGCMQDPASRGLAGAATGALLADATENDVLTGALIGGLAGAATCGIELGLPPCRSGY